MGFEPTTPFGASDVESDRWPIRLPSQADPPEKRARSAYGRPATRLFMWNLAHVVGPGNLPARTGRTISGP